MRLTAFTTSALIAGAAAFPAVSVEDDIATHISKRALSSKTETNAGFFPNKDFDPKDQYVDVRPGSGHEFQAPQKGDVRGPCPGLNAAANHGFTSRTGINDYHDTTEGLLQGLGIGKDFTNILFVFSVFNSGSFINMAWSIGGPMDTTTLGLLGKGLGLSNSHNKYEGDSSPGRGDAFLHNGDAHSLNLPNFQKLLDQAGEKDNYDMASMRRHIVATHEFTIQNNPYGFFGPGFFVSPIAHEFVTAMMSNHSKENVGGVLTKEVLMSFFSVKKDRHGTLTWVPGNDRIPDNWYRRPTHNPYGLEAAFGDFALTVKENPQIADIGGNMGKPNTFAGIEIENLTGGVFNSKNLLEGNNLACFALQGLTIATPGVLEKVTNGGGPLGSLTSKVIGGALTKFSCPQLSKQDYNMPSFEQYPGYKKKVPLQPATPY